MKKENVRYRVITDFDGKTILKPTKNRSRAYKFAREWNRAYYKKYPDAKFLNLCNPAYVYKEWTEGKGKYKEQWGEPLN